MKTHFPGYYPLEDGHIDKLLNTATIVLDVESLLCLFRIRDDYSTYVLTILQDYSPKLWMPYDVAWLYHHKMNSEILTQIQNITNTLAHFTSCKTGIRSLHRYPYLSVTTIRQLDLVEQLLVRECDNQKVILANRLTDCTIKNSIDELFKNKVGGPYSDGDLINVYKEGADRYAQLIPPGFLSDDNADKRIKFHDFIVWKQLQKQANLTGNDIVLVTGLVRRDWYYMVDNQMISTLHSLINEFYRFTGKRFYCISLVDFVRQSTKHGNYNHLNLSELYKVLSIESSYTAVGQSFKGSNVMPNEMNSI